MVTTEVGFYLISLSNSRLRSLNNWKKPAVVLQPQHQSTQCSDGSYEHYIELGSIEVVKLLIEGMLVSVVF